MKVEETKARRYAIHNRAMGGYYLTMTNESVMAHRPNESDPTNATEYTLINAVCRLSSKLRGLGFTWSDIANQLEQSGVGFKTVAGEIATTLRQEETLSRPATPAEVR